MSQDRDLIKLYSGRILALAAAIPRIGHLGAPDATARRRSPLCGSTVTVELKVDHGRISDFAQDVKACALGQAAASVIGAEIIGSDIHDIKRLRDELKAMLEQDGPPPTAPFQELEVLIPARAYKNRHASILLAAEATLEALEQAEAQDCA